MPSFTASDSRVLFIDTWGWLVVANVRHPAHLEATADRRAHSIIVTTDYVLDETFTRMFARFSFPIAQRFCDGILHAEDSGALRLERIDAARFAEAYRLRLKFSDKQSISFTDLTSFVVMRELGIRRVLTGDAHFAQVGFGFHLLPRNH